MNNVNSGCVSVVIPVYNGERYLQRAIDGVLAQTYTDVEIVVIDDGSTDSSPTMLREYGDRLCVTHQANCGNVGLVRNTGIERSRGEFVAFLDQDDWWLPEKLQKQVDMMRSDDRIGLVHTGVTCFDNETGNETGPLNPLCRPERMIGECYEVLLLGNPLYNSSVLVRRSVIDRVGPCDSNIKGNTIQDYGLWLRVAKTHRFGFVPDAVTCYRIHAGQGMWDRRAMLEAELELLLRLHDISYWKSDPRRRQRLANLNDELAVSYLDHGNQRLSRSHFQRAAAISPSLRQVSRFAASCLPSWVLKRIRPTAGKAP